jgi:hypothetical protein
MDRYQRTREATETVVRSFDVPDDRGARRRIVDFFDTHLKP